jgi:4-amino-4-deoxy-L-arabinose transferase-like glycosyltransferase
VRRELTPLLAAAALLYVVGIWWGVPWQWGPDELGPDSIYYSIDMHFAGGWHDKYPPMQYFLSALVCLPAYVAAKFGWVTLTSFETESVLLILMRLLTVVMSVGAVAAIYATARGLYGRRGAAAAAIVAGFTPVFVFYAKLANVDAPSLFWFACALYFYARAVRGGAARDLLGYALTAVTAIATKDQTGGFFVLPSLHLAWLAARRHEWRPLLIAAAASVVVLVFEMGMPFNFEGFRAHMTLITGEASQPFRLRGSVWQRQTMVAWLTVVETAWCMAWIGFAAAVGGIAIEIRRRRFLWLLLPAISYYLFFLVVAGYVYDRFVVGLGFVLSIFAGALVDRVLDATARVPRWRVAVCAVGLAFVVWTGVSIDLMMVLDSRYAAARWIAAHRVHGRVGLVGFQPYLPYIPGGVRLMGGPNELEGDQRPIYVIVNAELLRRGLLPPVERTWQRFLDSGQSRYVVVARFKTLPRAALLSYLPAFRNGVEDPETNLDKVGPEIVIYWWPGERR